MAARLDHRLKYPVSLEASQAPAWERFVAVLTHRLFYLILLVSPLLGWPSVSANGLTVSLFGLVTLPAIAAPKAHWALTAGDVHATAMWVLLALITMHAAAALYHTSYTATALCAACCRSTKMIGQLSVGCGSSAAYHSTYRLIFRSVRCEIEQPRIGLRLPRPAIRR
jgi:hypothetical protein